MEGWGRGWRSPARPGRSAPPCSTRWPAAGSGSARSAATPAPRAGTAPPGRPPRRSGCGSPSPTRRAGPPPSTTSRACSSSVRRSCERGAGPAARGGRRPRGRRAAGRVPLGARRPAQPAPAPPAGRAVARDLRDGGHLPAGGELHAEPHRRPRRRHPPPRPAGRPRRAGGDVLRRRPGRACPRDHGRHLGPLHARPRRRRLPGRRRSRRHPGRAPRDIDEFARVHRAVWTRSGHENAGAAHSRPWRDSDLLSE